MSVPGKGASRARPARHGTVEVHPSVRARTDFLRNAAGEVTGTIAITESQDSGDWTSQEPPGVDATPVVFGHRLERPE